MCFTSSSENKGNVEIIDKIYLGAQRPSFKEEILWHFYITIVRSVFMHGRERQFPRVTLQTQK